MSFEENIYQWIQLDNQLKIINEKTYNLREIKNNLTQKIMNHVEQNNLSKSSIKLGDNTLKFVNNKTPQPITFKYLESCLKDIIKNEEQIKQIIGYIKQKREIKNIFEIKRLNMN